MILIFNFIDCQQTTTTTKMLYNAFKLACRISSILILVLSCSSLVRCARNQVPHQPEYMHEWALKVSDPLEADLIAAETGFINKGPIEPFADIYLFQNPKVPHRSRRSAQLHTDKLKSHEKVLWAEQLVTKLRTKRDFVFNERSINDPEWENQWYLVSCFFF